MTDTAEILASPAPAVADGGRPLAVVTGGTGGIGRRVVELLAGAGYRVTVLSRQGAMAGAMAGAGFADDMPVTLRACDLGRAESIAAASSAILAQDGPVSLLVHCAGVIHPGDSAAQGADELAAQVAVNLTGPIDLTARLLGRMQRGGHVVFVNSMAGALPLAGCGAYTAAKFGLRGYAMCLAREVRKQGIRVSSVFPAAVDTPMLRREMAEGGSVLNFVSAPADPDHVARRIVRICRHPRRETFLPAMDGLFANLCLLLPRLLDLALPVLTLAGRLGYRRFVRRGGGR
ncbi:short-chain dehydrogenase/reductase SDR [Gluconacetobacter diazotrophicus PA1 5]|uniref:SDR family NAD(P)-dependent oxidoreductase n=2 Tax=Gluconacetobacter diazotrophicus TaxID=33996 RepID=A0A7W4FCD7_GLUDI|nr:SDR family NAD(P)-dependent oxidoreductase [Gluconacetobacter diazotrophicus]ACI51116.1 short-chain dehydrogenase/reductase SDR [Gluconacetobacter diazotrophicus PA1 5]MBB2155170.1 SDR family NAD(P)-dependent oxidoreductase [Gluconacetobacter diazotrophicus]TWB07609.1 short-subunit dehydrogenase [Gluconacetobacter diazotrophicus]CAP54618.1 putative short chain dehydrogenase [Gluconacetobacter diazotrophicus PA1 5]